MDRIQIVRNILEQTKGKTYLEIGAAQGGSFYRINAETKFAIDPHFEIKPGKKLKKWIFSLLKLKEERLFEMTSDAFFLTKSGLLKKKKIDVALIDGLHTYEQSLKDVLNCLNYLSEKGVMVIHDCNPQSEVAAFPASSFEDVKNMRLDGWTGEWSGDVWKTIVHLRSIRKDLNVFVLDCDFGVAVVTKGNPENSLNYSTDEIKAMSYRNLEAERAMMLNLKPESYMREFMQNMRRR